MGKVWNSDKAVLEVATAAFDEVSADSDPSPPGALFEWLAGAAGDALSAAVLSAAKPRAPSALRHWLAVAVASHALSPVAVRLLKRTN